MNSRCEQHLETVPGFRSRDLLASKMSDLDTHVNVVAQRTPSRSGFLGIDWGIEDDRLWSRIARIAEHIRSAFSLH